MEGLRRRRRIARIVRPPLVLPSRDARSAPATTVRASARAACSRSRVRGGTSGEPERIPCRGSRSAPAACASTEHLGCSRSARDQHGQRTGARLGESQSGHRRQPSRPPAGRARAKRPAYGRRSVRHVRPSPAPARRASLARLQAAGRSSQAGCGLLRLRGGGARSTPLFRAVLASWRWTRFSDARRCRTAQSAGSRGAAPAASPRRVPASRSAARSPARQAPEAAPWGRQARTGSAYAASRSRSSGRRTESGAVGALGLQVVPSSVLGGMGAAEDSAKGPRAVRARLQGGPCLGARGPNSRAQQRLRALVCGQH